MELKEPDAQATYGRWLLWGTRLGLALLVAAFILYLAGLAPHVPIERLPELWKGSAARLLAETGLATGWAWAAQLPRGDMLALAAIGVLATCSVAPLLAVLPLFRARGERTFVVICVLQVAVLVLAASGVLATH